MALDAALLSLVTAELKTRLAEARIDKIFEPTRDEVVISLRTRTETMRLLLSARSGSARICLTEESFENPAVPPSFCMLLRKHLAGGRLLDVRQLKGDRIVFLDFQCMNEMGDLVQNTLAAELMGRYSNLVLIQNDKILDALKRVDFEDSEIRQLLPGLPYTLPPKPSKPDFFAVSPAGLVAAAAARELPVADALIKSVGGVGPVLCREAVWRAFGDNALQANELTGSQQAQLAAAIEGIREEYEQGGVPCAVVSPEGKPVEYSFIRPQQYGPAYTYKEYPGYSELLEGYYATKDRTERLRQKSKELHKAVRNMYDRALRKQAARKEEQAQSEASDQLRVWGELLNANLWRIEKGMTSILVDNYYDGTQVKIKLDPRLNATGNAQKYFKDYKKKQTAARMLVQLLEQGEQEIRYLETVLYEVEAATGEQAIGEIRAELKSQGYLKYYKVRDKRQKPADFYRYESSDGFPILVGRNNVQNDKLTLHTARGCDLWFHTKNAPGSHTIVITEGRPVPNSTKEEAAQLAVLHSSQSAGVKVAVDYTQVRNIRKTGDLKPGMVLYEQYETAYITPDPSLKARLEKKAEKN